jgi:osmotically-inducible protein OsmY
MSLNQNSRLALLAACAAAATAAAQPPQSQAPQSQAPQAQAPQAPAPQPPPPDASSPPEAHEPTNVSDAQLGLEVQSRLYQALEVSNLSALVRYGVATLNGSVGNEEDRQRAEQLALAVKGIESVVNKLAVDSPVVVALADQAQAIVQRQSSEVETAIINRLRLDPVLGSRNIRVQSDGVGNTVTLSGTVSTPDEKEMAGRIAVSAYPTGRIRNQLEVQQRL